MSKATEPAHTCAMAEKLIEAGAVIIIDGEPYTIVRSDKGPGHYDIVPAGDGR